MTTLVFPGQGSQYLGMAKDFYENFKSAQNVFEIVEDSTKINVRKIIFENSENLLNITKYTQICVFTASMAIFEVFSEIFNNTLINNINFVLGHSLGEYSALTASKSIDIQNCSKLLKIRGELMQEAYPENQSTMAAIIGLNCASLEKIIKDNAMDIEIANDNAPGQVVVSGVTNKLKSCEKILIENGAKKIVFLNVSAAFHSNIMKKAEEKMKKSLEEISFKTPLYNIVSNYTGFDSKDISVVLKNLSNQMSNRVKWLDSIKLIESKNERNIIEIGPGKILTGIIRRISKKFNHLNITEVKDIEILENAI